MLAALYLRLKPAILRPIIFDEAFTITHLIKFDSITAMIEADPSVPPLHYLLIKLLSNYSTKALWLRLPSIVFSLMGLYISYKLAKKFSDDVAFLTLLMLSFSSFLINYTWQAYVYSQLFFLGTLAIYTFFILLTDEKIKRQNFLVLIVYISSVLAFFTHYGFIWTIAGFVLISLYKLFKSKLNFKKINRTDKKIILVTALICLSIVAYAPIFLKIFNRAMHNIIWFKTLNIFSLGESLSNLFGFYDAFSFNTFLISNLNKIIFTILFIFLLLCLIKLKNQKINYLIIISLSNLMLPMLLSVLMKQSIHADRAIIIVSTTLSILFSIFIKKLFNDKYYYYFLIIFSIFFIFFTNKINRTNYYIFQQDDLSKYFVDWFRKHPEHLMKENNFLINYNQFDSLDTMKFSNLNYLNYVVFNYYWKGFDGNPPLYEYRQINSIEDISNKRFYLLSMSDPDEKICMNNILTKINQNGQKQTHNIFSFYDSLKIYLYECNSE